MWSCRRGGEPVSNRGFTLVEVVVALVVVQVGVLAALSTTFVAARTLRHATELERAVHVVEWLTDSLPSAPGADSLVGPGFRARWAHGSGGTTITVTSGSIRVRVAPVPDGGS